MSYEPNEEALSVVAVALDRILSEPNRWVALRSGEAYVQFDGSPERSPCGTFDLDAVIWIDLPCRLLTDQQQDGAAKLFAEWGVEGPSEVESLTRKDRRFMLAAWRCNCGRDTKRAAIRGFRVLRSVYGLRDIRPTALIQDEF